MPLPERISIHIGAHKTATTHLQRSFYRARAKLARHGVTFLGPDEMRGGQFPLGEVMKGPGEATELRSLVAERLADLCAGRPVLVISEENLPGVVQTLEMPRSGRFYPKADARLTRLLTAIGAPVRLCLGVRDPARFLASAFTQQLMGGTVGPFEAYIGDRDPATMRWSDYVRRLLVLPNVTGLTVWRHEDYADVGPAILDRMTGRGAAGVTLLDKTIHAGLSAAAYAQVAQAIADGRANEPGLVQAAKKAYPKGDEFPGFDPWDEETASRSRAAYAADMAEIEALDGVEVLRPGKA